MRGTNLCKASRNMKRHHENVRAREEKWSVKRKTRRYANLCVRSFVIVSCILLARTPQKYHEYVASRHRKKRKEIFRSLYDDDIIDKESGRKEYDNMRKTKDFVVSVFGVYCSAFLLKRGDTSQASLGKSRHKWHSRRRCHKTHKVDCYWGFFIILFICAWVKQNQLLDSVCNDESIVKSASANVVWLNKAEDYYQLMQDAVDYRFICKIDVQQRYICVCVRVSKSS